jgi:hypothetical protein
MVCPSRESGDLHNVPRENGVDTIADGALDVLVGALCYRGGSKDKHVKVEEEPPKWSGIDGICVGIGDGMNRECLERGEGSWICYGV